LVNDIDAIQLPTDSRIDQATLYALVNAIRVQETTYKSSGSVHGCALFKGAEMLMFVEDVGRHNAVDTIAGWMAMNDVSGHDKVFYTTGRLTSEMVIKSAQMGVPLRCREVALPKWAWKSRSVWTCAPLAVPPTNVSCASALRIA
jgi:FdhD protein